MPSVGGNILLARYAFVKAKGGEQLWRRVLSNLPAEDQKLLQRTLPHKPFLRQADPHYLLSFTEMIYARCRGKNAKVVETRCRSEGDTVCEYRCSWE